MDPLKKYPQKKEKKYSGVGVMPGHCFRRWPRFSTTLGQCPVPADISGNPGKASRSPSAGSMLDCRRRRRTSIKATLDQRLSFFGEWLCL